MTRNFSLKFQKIKIWNLFKNFILSSCPKHHYGLSCEYDTPENARHLSGNVSNKTSTVLLIVGLCALIITVCFFFSASLFSIQNFEMIFDHCWLVNVLRNVKLMK